MSDLDDMDFSQPSPPPRPNFVAPAREYHRAQERAAVVIEETHGIRAWWNGLTEDDRQILRDLFKQSDVYERVGALTEHFWKKGRDPIYVLNWCREEARKAGAR